MEFTQKQRYDFEDLRRIMDILRSENGCPWDREQDHASIRKNFIEEVYEVCDAIDRGDAADMTEELGDVLLQVVFHAKIAQQAGEFTLDDVTDGICKKLIVRHPHIFGDLKLKSGSSDEVLSNWENIKNSTKKDTAPLSPIAAVPKCLPGPMRIQKLAKRAQKAGAPLPPDDVAASLTEFAAAPGAEKGGALLAAVCELLRKNGVDAEEALELYADGYVGRILG